jgi:hypothetical protein
MPQDQSSLLLIARLNGIASGVHNASTAEIQAMAYLLLKMHYERDKSYVAQKEFADDYEQICLELRAQNTKLSSAKEEINRLNTLIGALASDCEYLAEHYPKLDQNKIKTPHGQVLFNNLFLALV